MHPRFSDRYEEGAAYISEYSKVSADGAIDDVERFWTVKDVNAENLRMSRTAVIELIDDGRFGPWMNVGRGEKILHRVPESGRPYYLVLITTTRGPTRSRSRASIEQTNYPVDSRS